MVPVFELIKSLTPKEKGYFRKFCELQKGEKNYLDLFNVLEKMNHYDEAVLAAAFRERSFFKDLHVVRNYLYNLIMRSLRSFHWENTIDQKINDQITDAVLLEKRGLYEQARSSLVKARKLALKFHRYFLLIPITKKESSLWPLLEERRLQEKMQKINEDLLAASEEIRNEIAICVYYNRWTNFQRVRQQEGSSGTWEQLLEEWTNFEKNHPQDGYSSFYSSYLMDCIRATIAFFQKDPQTRFVHSARVLEKWAANDHMIKEEPHVYKIHLSNHLSCCFQLEKWELFPDLIAQLKALPSGNFNEEAETFQNYAFYEQLYLLNTLNFEGARESLDHITQGLQQYKAKINKARELTFYYNISVLYFMLEDFDKALLWLVRILNHPPTDHRKDLQRLAQILQLFYHYELGNVVFLEGMLPNVRRKINRWAPLTEWEVFLFQLLDNLMTATSKKGTKEIIKKNWEALQSGKHKASLGFDEIEIWLKKKAT
ncbi:MAG: hypothetical protein HUU01_09825 [Saprospiraceae bacterium]|nr:hypothetical protein [Saprospiraceae bacterium]